MMRGLAIAVALGLTGACVNSSFECVGDHQCSLAGQPGMCVSGGLCAYPDAECPSGLAFPSGSSSELAGECVPGDPVSTGPSSSTGSVPPTTSASSPTATATSTSSPTASADLDSDTSSVDPDLGANDTGVPECEDPFEPNDTQLDASPLDLERSCQVEWEARIEDIEDVDWYVLNNTDVCPPTETLTFLTEPALVICVVASCDDGTPALLLECFEEEIPLMGQQACCGVGQALINAQCEGNLLPTLEVGIGSERENVECLPYVAGVYL